MAAEVILFSDAQTKGDIAAASDLIAERILALSREELLLELREKVQTLLPSKADDQFVHELFVAGYDAAIAAVLGMLEGST